ncbi:MAG: PDZ domain-containing protein [Candidatus Rokuibacteriota bacterium]
MTPAVRVLALVALLVTASAADARSWAWLGVRIRDMSEQEMHEISARHGIREGFGVVIVEVLEDTPAARAGLKSGDIVVALGKRPVTETRLLQRLIAAAPTEVATRLTILRREGRRQVDVRLADMPLDIVGDRVAAEFGFVLREAATGPAPGGLSPTGGPPAVAAVLRGGPAEQAGLEVGDVVLQVGDREVLTREAVRTVLAVAALDEPLRLTVRRGERRLTITLPTP